MKYWAFEVLGLYGICVSGIYLFVGGLLGYFPEILASEIRRFFSLFILLPLLFAQGGLLLIPLRKSFDRPVGRRSLRAALVLATLPFGLLSLGFFLSLQLLLFGETKVEYLVYGWPVLVVPFFFWAFWGLLFSRYASRKDDDALVDSLASWLLKGSILELLVAIPSHVISRYREECCAPFVTYLGIVTGLSVALLAFGPGILALFARKIGEKRRSLLPGRGAK